MGLERLGPQRDVGDGVASSQLQGTGASYSRTFNTAGTFSYTCTLHGGMNGSVLVKQ